MHYLRILIPALVGFTGCAGETEPTDSDLPEGCALWTNADTYDVTGRVGQAIPLGIQMEARCQQPLIVSLRWRDPTSGMFSLANAPGANPAVTLNPYDPFTLDVTYEPTNAGSHEDRLVVQSNDEWAGGVILRIRGQASE